MSRTLDLLDEIVGDGERDFAVRLPDGSLVPPEGSRAQLFTLVIRSPSALRRLVFSPSELTLGESFVRGDLDVEGSLEAVFPLAERMLGRTRSARERLRIGSRALTLPRGTARATALTTRRRLRGRRHSAERDRTAVGYHYDLPPEFYATFLDRRLVYSCAYFASVDESLDVAQERKLDYLCRKLRLRAGERLLDIGCGFGALALHAAENYGADVVGVTLSRVQAEVARERVAAARLSNRCRIELRDYRELDKTEPFDKLVSVGMFEHVGPELLPDYFGHAWSLLRPGGVFLNHGIATNALAKPPRGETFWEHYVFPDGGLATIGAALVAAEGAGFEVRDVESLREHYALTLRAWVRRLEHQQDAARAAVGEERYRVWLLYMSAGAHRFSVGRLNVYQTLLARPDRGASGLPLARADWYAGQPSSANQ
jgi:cyclopropane-fatty-acyl-phospholipid synthase